MCVTVCMHVMDSAANLTEKSARLLFLEAIPRHNIVKELARCSILQHEKELCGRLHHLVQLCNVLVSQRLECCYLQRHTLQVVLKMNNEEKETAEEA